MLFCSLLALLLNNEKYLFGVHAFLPLFTYVLGATSKSFISSLKC